MARRGTDSSLRSPGLVGARRTDGGALRQIRRAVLDWYAAEHRDFPWRHTRDPYAVLVSEVMLQQTQASRVAERFPQFLDRFRSAAELAAASDGEVLAAWSGLGYNRRAIALKRTAARVAEDGWPRSVSDLQRLPGIGPYTARAIASLAFEEPVGVVDTNVRRWLVRRFGLDPTGADGAPVRLQALADALAAPGGGTADPDEVAAWTHATMELGAAVCTARRPACAACPIAVGCPSQGHAGAVPVPRHAPFPGSSRAVRGAILRLIAFAPHHRLPQADLHGAMRGLLDRDPAAATAEALAGLERDGLVHRQGAFVRLGAREAREGAATIDP
ncbi:MAG: A/G-specific adenine glycosylase [Chloroflexota bacterium]|nr:A/G-specific adenine glycosylase [Chloroflexota bacterium]